MSAGLGLQVYSIYSLYTVNKYSTCLHVWGHEFDPRHGQKKEKGKGNLHFSLYYAAHHIVYKYLETSLFSFIKMEFGQN
jgi:hypothetical protein